MLNVKNIILLEIFFKIPWMFFIYLMYSDSK